ncbi:hypothetical protein ACFYE4_15470, partial [Kocuria sp. CPCC 205295]|uniref:hypothetical protein n=1 Tax=Kocuria sp. CPCC 205295 TaxID=3073557 RepID=UPI0036D8F32C
LGTSTPRVFQRDPTWWVIGENQLGTGHPDKLKASQDLSCKKLESTDLELAEVWLRNMALEVDLMASKPEILALRRKQGNWWGDNRR